MNRVLHIALLLLVVLAPLPLGSNREWSWTACALVAGLLAIAWSVAAMARPGMQIVRLPAGPAVLFLAACAWVVVQFSPWAPGAWAHPLWAMSSEVTGHAGAATISLSPEDSRVALMRLLSYGLVFFLSFQLAADPDRARAAFRWLAGAGLAYALFGLVLFWGELETRLWFQPEGAHASVRGPFVNRNSFATWLGLCLLCALALFYQRLALRRNPLYTMPAGREQRIEEFILRAWKPLAMILLMLSALILTYSRAGFGSFLAGAVVLALAVNHRQPFIGSRSGLVVLAAFSVAALAFFMTSEVLLQRMDFLEADAPGRFQVYALAGAASEENRWLGFGYGTFADSFRLYRDDSLRAHYDMAHNTWVENAFELGWAAAGALFAALAWVAGMCLTGLRRRGRDWIYPATGLAASVLAGVHAVFDFSLQMPAVALAYACLMGTACAQARSSRGAPR